MKLTFHFSIVRHEANLLARVELSVEHVEAAVECFDRYLKQFAFAFENALFDPVHDLSTAKVVRLVIHFPSGENGLARLSSELVLALGRVWEDRKNVTGVCFRFSASLPRGKRNEPQRLEEPDPILFALAEKAWTAITEDCIAECGNALEGQALVEFAISEAAEASNDEIQCYVIAVGVWLGDELISRVPSLSWQLLRDEFGVENVLFRRADDESAEVQVYPLSIVQKRFEAGVTFDADHLIDDLTVMFAEA